MSRGQTLHETIKRPPVLSALPARIYLLLIQCLGLSVLVYTGEEAIYSFDLQWLYLLFLTAVASLLSTKISGGGTKAGSVTISLGVFMSMVTLGPGAATLTGAVEGLVSSIRVRVRHTYKILFNVCQLALSSFLFGSLASYLLEGATLRPQQDQPVSFGFLEILLFCGLLYFLLNSLLVAGAMFLVARLSAREIRRKDSCGLLRRLVSTPVSL